MGKENLLCLLLEFLQESSRMKCDNIYLDWFQSILNVISVAYYIDIVKKYNVMINYKLFVP
jgi:lipopolysaccharide biosynthesis glycosyltransferase